MKTSCPFTRSISLIIVTAMLLALAVVSPASAQTGIVLTITGGDNQTATTGTAFALPLQVAVTIDGAPAAGAVVQFVAPGWGASLNAAYSATTDASGVASASVTANPYSGAYQVTANSGGVSAVFHLTNLNPYYLAPRCECNVAVATSNKCGVCASQTTQVGCEKYAYCWWRDTTNQNALSQHTFGEFTDRVSIVWQSTDGSKLVAVHSSPNGANVAVVIDGLDYALIGCGGRSGQAAASKSRFARAIPRFGQKVLGAVVVPAVNYEFSYGCGYWNPYGVHVFAHASYWEAVGDFSDPWSAYLQRSNRAYGGVPTWGVDSFLGSGSMQAYPFPEDEMMAFPTGLVSSEMTITPTHGIPITLIPASGKAASLLVYLPDQQLMIVPDLGKYLPDAASITHRNPSVAETIAALNLILARNPQILVPLNGLPIVNSAEAPNAVSQAVMMQRDALQYVHDATVQKIDQSIALNDIVDQVRLPPQLVGRYTEELASTVPFVVRQVYQESMGWFDGDAVHLESLPSLTEARKLIEFGGGQDAVLSYVKKRLTAHNRDDTLDALQKVSALRRVYPSALADAYYIQALKMLAWTTPSAHIRNYYLSLAQEVTAP